MVMNGYGMGLFWVWPLLVLVGIIALVWGLARGPSAARPVGRAGTSGRARSCASASPAGRSPSRSYANGCASSMSTEIGRRRALQVAALGRASRSVGGWAPGGHSAHRCPARSTHGPGSRYANPRPWRAGRAPRGRSHGGARRRVAGRRTRALGYNGTTPGPPFGSRRATCCASPWRTTSTRPRTCTRTACTCRRRATATTSSAWSSPESARLRVRRAGRPPLRHVLVPPAPPRHRRRPGVRGLFGALVVAAPDGGRRGARAGPRPERHHAHRRRRGRSGQHRDGDGRARGRAGPRERSAAPPHRLHPGLAGALARRQRLHVQVPRAAAGRPHLGLLGTTATPSPSPRNAAPSSSPPATAPTSSCRHEGGTSP